MVDGWKSYRTVTWSKDTRLIDAQVREADETVHIKFELLNKLLAELGWTQAH